MTDFSAACPKNGEAWKADAEKAKGWRERGALDAGGGFLFLSVVLLIGDGVALAIDR